MDNQIKQLQQYIDNSKNTLAITGAGISMAAGIKDMQHMESMQRVFWYVQSFEKDFTQKQMTAFGEEKKKELSEKRRELAQVKKRVTQLTELMPEIIHEFIERIVVSKPERRDGKRC